MVIDNLKREKQISELKNSNTKLKGELELAKNKVKLEKEKTENKNKYIDFMNYKIKKTYSVVFNIIDTIEDIKEYISNDEDRDGYYVYKIREWLEDIEENIPNFFYEYKEKWVDKNKD